MKLLFLLLLSTPVFAQNLSQTYPVEFNGKSANVTIEYDEYERLRCYHETRLWKNENRYYDLNEEVAKSYLTSPCNYAKDVTVSLSKTFGVPQDSALFAILLDAFVAAVPLGSSDTFQTPFETLVSGFGSEADKYILFVNLFFSKEVSKPLPPPTRQVVQQATTPVRRDCPSYHSGTYPNCIPDSCDEYVDMIGPPGKCVKKTCEDKCRGSDSWSGIYPNCRCKSWD